MPFAQSFDRRKAEAALEIVDAGIFRGIDARHVENADAHFLETAHDLPVHRVGQVVAQAVLVRRRQGEPGAAAGYPHRPAAAVGAAGGDDEEKDRLAQDARHAFELRDG